jgi:hypothetical protein
MIMLAIAPGRKTVTAIFVESISGIRACVPLGASACSSEAPDVLSPPKHALQRSQLVERSVVVLPAPVSSPATDDRDSMGPICKHCAEYLGSHSEKCPTIEQYRDLLIYYPGILCGRIIQSSFGT